MVAQPAPAVHEMSRFDRLDPAVAAIGTADRARGGARRSLRAESKRPAVERAKLAPRRAFELLLRGKLLIALRGAFEGCLSRGKPRHRNPEG